MSEKPEYPEVSWRIAEALATYKEGVKVVIMPCCGFSFDAVHTDDVEPEGYYTCPLCSPIEETLR